MSGTAQEVTVTGVAPLDRRPRIAAGGTLLRRLGSDHVQAIEAPAESTHDDMRLARCQAGRPRPTDPHLCGGKAASQAVAGDARLPTLGGAVLTTAFGHDVNGGSGIAALGIYRSDSSGSTNGWPTLSTLRATSTSSETSAASAQPSSPSSSPP
jgi:hypothetical protein